MKVLLSWLREFAPDIQGDPVELGETLSSLGLAVEEMTITGQGLDGIVLAKVLDLSPHPDADKIQIVQVDAGDGQPLQVCCGAFNMAVGDLIPFATIGTTMPNGMEIAQRKMRGQMSNGMCCSASEIGLGEDSDGIMLLTGQTDAALGAPINEALGITEDVLWDLEVNANRPDAMSVSGVARDLAAKLGVPFSFPDYSYTSSGLSSYRRSQHRDHRSVIVRPFPGSHHSWRHDRHLASVDATATHRPGHAPDQQRGRHQQLRDARTRATEPHL